MNRLKELLEKRAALVADVRKMFDTAAAEKRALTPEELESEARMNKEIEGIEATIKAEERQRNRERETPNPGEQRNGEQRGPRDTDEYRSALWSGYVMRNEVRADLNVGTDSAGGYLAPSQFENSIIVGLTESDVMRQLASVRRYDRDTDIPVKSGRATFAYIAEKGTYAESAQTYGQKSLKAYKSGGIIKVTEELMNDSVANIEAEIRDEIIYAESRCEEPSFVTGSGAGCPRGFTLDAETGVTTASATAITWDEIIDLFYSLKSPYRRKATWLANDAVIKYIRKLKDGDGRYLWQPALTVGAPDTIEGRPVRTSQDMASTITNSAKTIAFGDFSYYRIADRVGLSIQRLNELYAGTGQIGFRATMRNDGLLTLGEAVKLMVQLA